MIEGNLGKRIKPRHGPGLIKRTKYNEGSVVHGGPKVMPSIRLYNSAWEMNRTTPYDDRVVVIINIYWLILDFITKKTQKSNFLKNFYMKF